jgi:hypothetical protein
MFRNSRGPPPASLFSRGGAVQAETMLPFCEGNAVPIALFTLGFSMFDSYPRQSQELVRQA